MNTWQLRLMQVFDAITSLSQFFKDEDID